MFVDLVSVVLRSDIFPPGILSRRYCLSKRCDMSVQQFWEHERVAELRRRIVSSLIGKKWHLDCVVVGTGVAKWQIGARHPYAFR